MNLTRVAFILLIVISHFAIADDRQESLESGNASVTRVEAIINFIKRDPIATDCILLMLAFIAAEYFKYNAQVKYDVYRRHFVNVSRVIDALAAQKNGISVDCFWNRGTIYDLIQTVVEYERSYFLPYKQAKLSYKLAYLVRTIVEKLVIMRFFWSYKELMFKACKLAACYLLKSYGRDDLCQSSSGVAKALEDKVESGR